MSTNRLYRFAWLVMAANILVILWGAFVRATGSGAGCGSHWPLCNGEVLPPQPSAATLIEFTHRLTSGVALILVVVLLVWVYRAFDRGHPARMGALATFLLMLSEAGIGAGIVLFELVAENASMARALFMATHLGNTFLLLGALTLTILWIGGGQSLSFSNQGRLLWISAGAVAFTMLIGVSGAVSALGDTLFPPESHSEALVSSLSSTAHILIQLRILHPLLAVIGSLVLFYLVSVVREEHRQKPASRYARILNLLIFSQLTIGVLNISLKAPVAMQLIHLLLADAVWIVLILTTATALARRQNLSTTAPSIALGKPAV